VDDDARDHRDHHDGEYEFGVRPGEPMWRAGRTDEAIRAVPPARKSRSPGRSVPVIDTATGRMRATVRLAAKSTICQVIEPRSTTSFKTAPKRNHNASESSAPLSSTRCSASAGSRRASGSKKMPATNAAMNPLPPRTTAPA
jgi:hypothetical protein